MKKIIFLSILLIVVSGIFAQNQTDTITVKKVFFSPVYKQNGKILTPGKLLKITKVNEGAYNRMKQAKTNYDIGCVFGFAGGFMIGFPIGTSLGGGEPNWTLAGIGAGLTLVSIPFQVAYSKHSRAAVKLYNAGMRENKEKEVI